MKQNSPQVVISGAAMVTCLGLDRETVWKNVRAGKCGMVPLTAMEQPLAPGKLGGQAPDLPGDEEVGQPREVRYLRRVLLDAVRDAGLDPAKLPYPVHRCGMMIGTTLHGMRAGGEFLRTDDPAPLRNFLAASTLHAASRGLGLEGFAATTCSACSSSLGSVALAVTLLQSGQLDLVIAGGYDPISEYVYGGFNSLRLVAEGPLRPFGKNREGMKLAEGYGIVVLERESDAAARGHRDVLAKVLGFGESADAHHLTQPHPQGDGAARAMKGALASAGVDVKDIGLIAAHATGTPDNDSGEFAAMSNVFGEHLPNVPVVGFKSHMGHTLGGAGVVELILSAMALRDQVIPPCASVQADDVEYAGLNLATGKERPGKIAATLNTSLGFGGANTCIVLGLPDNTKSPGEPAQARRPAREVFITGIGVVLPGAVGNEAFIKLISQPAHLTQDTGSIADEAYLHLLNARRVRRMSEYVKLSLAATAVAFADAGITDIPAFSADCAAVLGSTHGSANFSRDYYKQIVDEGIPAANPMLFAEGVPNAAAAHLSLMMQLKGACQTIIGSRTAGLDALRLAAMRIGSGDWERAVVSAGEEFSPTVNAGYKHCGLYAGQSSSLPFSKDANGFVAGCGAVTFILESADSLSERGGRAHGRLEAFASASPPARGQSAAARRVLEELGELNFVMSSANGTRIDAAEANAIRNLSARTKRPLSLATPYGHVAETFSVNALAAIAAVLLTKKWPATAFDHAALGDAVNQNQALSGGDAAVNVFAVLATDYTGLVAGARISCKAKTPAIE